MARRGSKTRGQRDDTFPSLAELLAPLDSPLEPLSPLSFVREVVGPTLTEIEDRRRYHPEAAYRSPLSFSGLPATIGERYDTRTHVRSVGRATYPAIQSADPARYAVVCARRKKRREIMFALRKRKRGGGGGRRRRNYWSDVRC